MKNINTSMRDQFVALTIVGLFLIIGHIFAEESVTKEIPSSNKKYTVTMGNFGDYSSTMSSDRKTTIVNADGKKIAEEIWSPNKKFYAFAGLVKKNTTIYKLIEQRINIYRREVFWVMDGCFEMVGLSYDGECLVVGDPGGSTLPVDYKQAQVMLSFFKRGKLINQIKLSQLINDFSKLKRTDSGYYWGKYLRLNAAGYYVVEDAEGKKILFDLKTGKQAEFKPGEIVNLPNWKTYRDIMRCYEFQYPEDYFLKASSGDIYLMEGENKRSAIVISFEEIFRDWFNDGMSFEEFAVNRAKGMCDASMHGSSRYASDVLKKKAFTNSHNLKGVEIYLLEVQETHFENGKDVKIEKTTRGPIYAISVSRPDEPYRVLFFEFLGEGRKPLQGKEEELKKIANTVIILE